MTEYATGGYLPRGAMPNLEHPAPFVMRPMPSQLEYAAQGAEYAHHAWLEWLVDIGYGVDFTCTPPPPCEPSDLAEVYAETDGESVEDWTAILLDGNTSGGWYGNGKDHP